MRISGIASVLSAVFLSLVPVTAQVQAPLRVDAFGGKQASLSPIPVPPELKLFVPANSTLRALLTTQMTSSGEKLFLYDNGKDIFPEVHLHGLRYDNEFNLFDGSVAGIAGLLPLATTYGLQLVSFAYHQGGDQADTTFVIFGHENKGYGSVFQKQTTQGKMRILPGAPLRFELWDADTNLDPQESCVWCPHRYHVLTYEVQGSDFKVIAKRTTKEFLDPGEIAARPFAVMEKNKH
jgi:hypothetical protein